MSTHDEVATKYKNLIIREFRGQSDIKIASAITKSGQDRAVRVLKGIWDDLGGYTYTESRQLLSEETKREILTSTGEKLGLSRPDQFFIMVKSSSNDNFMMLLDYWDRFFNELEELEL